jgi:PmbA protein
MTKARTKRRSTSPARKSETREEAPFIAEYLIRKLKRGGADDVIVNATTEEATQLKFSNNVINTTKTWHNDKIDVFVSIEKKLVATSIKELTGKAADDVVNKMFKFVKAALPTKEYKGVAEGPYKYKNIPDTYDKAIENLDGTNVDILNACINAAKKNKAKRLAGVLETSVTNSYLLTSNNVEVEEKGTKAYFSIRAFVDKYASGHQVCNSRVLKKFKPETSAEKAAIIAKQAVNPKHGEPGNYDVIFSPLPFSNFLASFGEATSIFNVESKLSCLANKIGKRVASSKVNLVDDGSLPNGFGTSLSDDEGVPTQRNILVDKGVLKTYLHNTSTAKKHKTTTTANAGLVSPSPFNLVLEKGNFNKEEMIKQVKRGLIVTNVWYTRFQNYESGDFSTIPRDGMFLIENGKVKGAVKELRISDNLLRIMQNVAAVGKDQEATFGWEVEIPTVTPPVLVKDVRVTKSSN